MSAKTSGTNLLTTVSRPVPKPRNPTACWHWKRIVPFFIFSIIGWSIFVICETMPLFSPQGFFCKDPALSFKFQKSTVGDLELFIAGLGLPFIFIMVVEQLTVPLKRESSMRRGGANQALVWYMNYLSGAALLGATVNVIKVAYGEPRPHFFDTCKPKEAKNCTENTYIYKFTCTGKLKSKYLDSNLSFPSGHAAVSFYMFVYLAWHLQKRLKIVCSLSKLWMQTVLFVLACFVAISRITDHRHNWWDVLIGGFFGVVFGGIAVKYLSNNFNWMDYLMSDPETKPLISESLITESNHDIKLEINTKLKMAKN
ncbi:hypothetical protein GE061_015448 [Apolygus lucorum]|uniref:Phosphatidic acid phosphatase type 2/haloperoxidase domain-containing protein n=1 Tax=Apolygus lucorum TaxID=248454 RepID=A0A6A4JDE2_APOLU|nr:hypothetical protein GE061_015448 [Apolygus lucorum]